MIDKDRSMVAFINFVNVFDFAQESWLEMYLLDGTLVYLVVKVGEKRPRLYLIKGPDG